MCIVYTQYWFIIVFKFCKIVDGTKDPNKVKESAQFETVWHPQFQQQPVSNSHYFCVPSNINTIIGL